MSCPVCLLDVLATIPDPRDRRGLRHPLPAVLGLAVLAMLTGCQGYEAIAQFGRDKGFALAHALGFRRGKTPTKSTYSVLVRRLDIVAFEAALGRWVAARLSPEQASVLALDGKVLRGSRDGDVPGQHLVAAYAPAAAAVLAQVRVDAKTNEHKAALELLGILSVTSRIVTGDALFCQRDLCQKVVGDGGDYVVTVKDNQPSLAIDIRAGLSWEEHQRQRAAISPPTGSPAPPPAGSTATTVDKAHGRRETRTLRRTTLLSVTQDWAGLRQGFELTRTRTIRGRTTVETVYGITSLGPEVADARRLLDLTRGHWDIENRLHYKRDVTLGEDRSRVRKGTAPQVMAALRNSVVHLLNEGVADTLAAALRTMSNCFTKALNLLGLPQIE